MSIASPGAMRAPLRHRLAPVALGLALFLGCDSKTDPNSGGTGGATGGATATGGAQSTGGAPGTGGVSGTGGAQGSAGSGGGGGKPAGSAGGGGTGTAQGGAGGALASGGAGGGASNLISCSQASATSAGQVAGFANPADFSLNTDTGLRDQHTLMLDRGGVIRQVTMYTTAGAADHRHAVRFTQEELAKLMAGEAVMVTTDGPPLEAATGHSHTIKVTGCAFSQ